MTTANVVYSGPASDVKPIQEEAIIATGETIVPGNLVTLSSGEWINHDVEGQGGDFRVADLDFIRQKAVTEALTADETAQAFVPEPGQTYNLRLAASQEVVVGSPLTSNGDGTVKVAATTGLEAVLFYAREAQASTGSVTRIRARVATAGYTTTA